MGKEKKDKPYSWEEQYEKLDVLGTGGNARVFLVKSRESGQTYALKQLVFVHSEEKSGRFADEIRIMRQTSGCAGILPLLDSSIEAYWYTMPVAEPLLKHIQKERTSLRNIAKGVASLAGALALLHDKGISHRDLKPANLYYYNGQYCLGDFGLVEVPDNPNDFTREDKGLGAIFTIAPEMKRDPKHADGRSADVFSLAKTLWMLLAWDERGFDGVYNPLDRSHGLRYVKRFSGEHLVELEELLQDATGNDPAGRPDMGQFQARLLEWLTVMDHEDQAQASEWNFINRYLFGEHRPESVVWSDLTSILHVLNAVGTLRAFNHMLFSDHGGLDFAFAEPAAEEGCICITDDFGCARIGKPACLHLETFGEDYVWSYFLLEFAPLEPIFQIPEDCRRECLVEDFPGHYVSARDSMYGVYDYDTGVPLPEGWRRVERYSDAKFLIVLKGSPYNGIPATYDGRHGQCGSAQFRAYMEYLRKVYQLLRDQGADERQILHCEVFRKNPFAPEKERPVRPRRKPPYTFVKETYLTWRFSELPPPAPVDSLAFFLNFRLKNGGSLTELLEKYASVQSLCTDGSIKKDPPAGERYCTGDRAQAVALRARCQAQVAQWCREAGFDPPGLDGPYFELELERQGKPTHLFTKAELEALLRQADDRVDHVLVIEGDGRAQLLEDLNLSYSYPVRHPFWDARNGNVGKYADLAYVEELYLDSLRAWLAYLREGRPQAVESIPPVGEAASLLAQIHTFY